VKTFIQKALSLGYRSRIWGVAVDKTVQSFWIRMGFKTVSKAVSDPPEKFIIGSEDWWTAIETRMELPAIFDHTGILSLFFKTLSKDSYFMVFSLANDASPTPEASTA